MNTHLLVTALLASVTAAAGRQPQFKSGVELVYLDVTVQAPDGSIVRGLAKDDFVIYDEEAPQTSPSSLPSRRRLVSAS